MMTSSVMIVLPFKYQNKEKFERGHKVWTSLHDKWHYVSLHVRVKQGITLMLGMLGFQWNARIPVESNWNLELLQALFVNYDKEVVDWLNFGWPVSRPPNRTPPTSTYVSHGEAVSHPDSMKKS